MQNGFIDNAFNRNTRTNDTSLRRKIKRNFIHFKSLEYNTPQNTRHTITRQIARVERRSREGAGL